MLNVASLDMSAAPSTGCNGSSVDRLAEAPYSSTRAALCRAPSTDCLHKWHLGGLPQVKGSAGDGKRRQARREVRPATGATISGAAREPTR